MSKLEQEIIDRASDILATSGEVTQDDIKTVIVAGKLTKKEVTPGCIRKLIARTEEKELSDEDLVKIRADANKAVSALYEQKRLEKKERELRAGVLTGDKYPKELYKIGVDSEGFETIVDINHPNVIRYILKKLHTVSFNDTLYVYTDDGIYTDDMHHVSSLIIDILHDKNLPQSETSTTNNIILGLKGFNKYTDYPFDMPSDILVVGNGALKITKDTIELLPYSHEHMKTLKLDINFEPSVKPCNVMKVFHSWVDAEDVPILTQIIAQGLYQHMKRYTFKRNYLLQGSPDAGKSTFLDLLVKFVGMKNKCDVSLQQICNNERFLGAKFESLLFNIHDDLKDIPLDGSGNFNKLTGSCQCGIERKGKEEYQGIVTTPHVFSCNKPPSYDEKLKADEAWWKRWIFFSFPFSFERDTTFFERTVTKEFLTGLLNLVAAEIQYIQATHALRIVHDPTQVQERWAMLSDPLKMWIAERFDANYEVFYYDKEKLFKKYTEYVNETKVPIRKQITTEQNFCTKLQETEDFVSIKVPTNLKKYCKSGYCIKSKLAWDGISRDVCVCDPNDNKPVAPKITDMLNQVVQKT